VAEELAWFEEYSAGFADEAESGHSGPAGPEDDEAATGAAR
jgi:pyruvate dehydrogenase E1 component alpha subunit